MRRARALSLALLLAPLASAVRPTEVRAETTGDVPILEQLGRPADPDAVESLLTRSRSGAAGEAAILAFALGRAGGHAAATALSELARHPDAEVRTAALESAGRVGLRTRTLREAALAALQARGEGERVAALRALGAVGDGRDVPALLALTRSAPSRLRRAAFAALGALAGLSIPYDRERWSWWWRATSAQVERDLPHALEGLATGDAAEVLARHRRTVASLGWTDLVRIEPLLATWLRGSDGILRIESCRLAASLRLADLVPALRTVLEYAADDVTTRAARDALAALGAPEG